MHVCVLPGALVFSCNLLYCVLIIETIIIIVEKFNYTLLLTIITKTDIKILVHDGCHSHTHTQSDPHSQRYHRDSLVHQVHSLPYLLYTQTYH